MMNADFDEIRKMISQITEQANKLQKSPQNKWMYDLSKECSEIKQSMEVHNRP